jgi:hypothetical protein
MNHTRCILKMAQADGLIISFVLRNVKGEMRATVIAPNVSFALDGGRFYLRGHSNIREWIERRRARKAVRRD